MGHTSVPEQAAPPDATTPPDATGPQAVTAAGSPDATAIAALFRDHHAELVRLALLMVGDLPTAEDVVQDVYASLHRMSRNTNHPESPLPYVRAAVLNGCRSVQRRRAIARRIAIIHRASQPHDTLASAESEVILSEDRRQVLTALVRLPRRRREVLVLRYYLGLSEADIAAVLGISPGTVKSTAARALAALARDLGEPS